MVCNLFIVKYVVDFFYVIFVYGVFGCDFIKVVVEDLCLFCLFISFKVFYCFVILDFEFDEVYCDVEMIKLENYGWEVGEYFVF